MGGLGGQGQPRKFIGFQGKVKADSEGRGWTLTYMNGFQGWLKGSNLREEYLQVKEKSKEMGEGEDPVEATQCEAVFSSSNCFALPIL